MPRTYRITWAPPVVVTANDENEAWAKFCDGNEEARKHPKLYPRYIEEVVTTEDVRQPEEVTPVTTEVDQLPASEAIDRISRMRSRPHLEAIVNSDQRQTVKEAARKRLTEIPQ